ncbi:hypothetical protein BDV96DRAFT_460289, partial [Lophiotrema nucula]
SNVLPDRLYRLFYETSATLCCFVSKDTHTKHREKPELKLEHGNAFQALGQFNPTRDLTKDRIVRHLVWNRKSDPSSFISAFNHIDHARRRADFHYRQSQRIGQRVSVAEIDSTGLIAATVHRTIKETTRIFRDGKLKSKTEKSRDIQIPIWVRENARPSDHSPITKKQLIASGADIWLSITELRHSDLRIGYGKGHDYEWLAGGSIPSTRILRVMPYDGRTLHERPGSPGSGFVKSLDSPLPWTFDWEAKMWQL